MMALHVVEMLVMVVLVSVLFVIYYPTIVPVITHASSRLFSMLCHPILLSNVLLENSGHAAVPRLPPEDDSRTVANP